jgi:hypothetical protein
MEMGDILTRATIWLALSGYAAWFVTALMSRRNPNLRKLSRLALTIGCAFFLAHVFCAFNYHYDWSHANAFQRTAEQVGKTMGVESGWGVYVSYAFTLAWTLDVTWWWFSGPDSYEQRPRFLITGWHLFFLFMVFNGTVVFETGYSRWLGLALCLGLAGFWIFAKIRKQPAIERVEAS